MARYPLVLRLLRKDELQEAAWVAGRGMCDNPANLRVFRISNVDKRASKLGRFFGPVLRGVYERGFVLGAFCSDKLVGVCGIARPGFCQPTSMEKLRIFPAVVLRNSAGTPFRILRWAGEWAHRDPDEPHWHLGPVAVEPGWQGRGIGSAMLEAFCAVVDGFRGQAYLETDKPENLGFYEKFGFTTMQVADVLGVPNWFMSRAAKSEPKTRDSRVRTASIDS